MSSVHFYVQHVSSDASAIKAKKKRKSSGDKASTAKKGQAITMVTNVKIIERMD